MAEDVTEKEEFDMRADFQYFLDNIGNLFCEYGDRFVVIKNKAVLGSYDTAADAITNTTKSEKMGTFIVQRCAPSVECVTAHFAGNVVV